MKTQRSRAALGKGTDGDAEERAGNDGVFVYRGPEAARGVVDRSSRRRHGEMDGKTHADAEGAAPERIESEQTARDALEHPRRANAEEPENSDGARAVEDCADRARDENHANRPGHAREAIMNPAGQRRDDTFRDRFDARNTIFGVAQPTARTPASENCAICRATASMFAGVGSNLRPRRSAIGFGMYETACA